MSSYDDSSCNSEFDSGTDYEDDSVIINDISDEEEMLCNDFMWKEMKDYKGQRGVYTAECGPRNGAEDATDIVSCFELFFDKTIIEHIVIETNRYAKACIAAKRISWKQVTESEIYTVLGIFILMGIIQKPTTKSYFTKRRIISTPGFGDVISRDRFESICKFLHFVNNDDEETYARNSKLFKIQPILSYFNEKFKTFYLPEQNITINESLILWNGCLSFKQFIPLRSSTFDMKTFELCELKTGYLWSFLVHAGKETNLESSLTTAETPKRSAIVLKLMEPLLHREHTLWMDNFYNSPDLAKKLKMEYLTDCVGTLRLYRKNVPEIVRKKKLRKGEIIARHSGPVTVLKWCDKKYITMLSTYHGEEVRIIRRRDKEIVKPSCVIDYDYNMGRIELKDQLLNIYLIEKKNSNKWYIKLFKRLLNAAILNSLIIYRKTTQDDISHISYRIQLVERLFLKHATNKENISGAREPNNTVLRLTERHFLKRISAKTEKTKSQRRCVVCSKHGKKKTSIYHCQECNVGLCVDNCFELYHTKLNY